VLPWQSVLWRPNFVRPRRQRRRFLSNLTTTLTVNATLMGIAQPCATLRLDADVSGVVSCGDVLNGV
jgi:hypothetical protein